MAAKKRSPKVQEVTLCTKGENKRERKFAIAHALEILRLPNSQWEVSDDNYIFEGNDIKRRPSTGDTQKSKEQETS